MKKHKKKKKQIRESQTRAAAMANATRNRKCSYESKKHKLEGEEKQTQIREGLDDYGLC